MPTAQKTVPIPQAWAFSSALTVRTTVRGALWGLALLCCPGFHLVVIPVDQKPVASLSGHRVWMSS